VIANNVLKEYPWSVRKSYRNKLFFLS
jgi:hypothetical protein